MINIIVRSYKRAEMFRSHTLQALLDQKDLDLGKQFYLILADKSEYEDYKPFLVDVPICDIMYSGVGGNVAHNKAFSYFPEGEKLILMDDDMKSFKHWKEISKSKEIESVENLGELFQYTFDQMEQTKLGHSVLFNFASWLYQQNLPFFEFRPKQLGGTWFGGFNCKEFQIEQSHEDDNIRTSRFLEKDGGVYQMNWFSLNTRMGINEGGMQSSGDRGSKNYSFKEKDTEEFLEYRKKFTYDECMKALQFPTMKRFYNPVPQWNESMRTYCTKIKNKKQLKLEMDYNHVTWQSYLQKESDPVKLVLNNQLSFD